MDQEKYLSETSTESLHNSLSTVDSLNHRLSIDSLEEWSETEEKIISYLKQLNIQFFTSPTSKEDEYNQQHKHKIFQNREFQTYLGRSSLMQKRSLLFHQ